MSRNIAILSILCLITSLSYSQNLVVLSDNTQSVKIGKNISYFIDNSKKISYSQILTSEYQDQFIKSEADIPFFDYQNSTIWLKFIVTDKSTKEQNFDLLIDYPLLYKVRLFNYINNKIDTLFNGDGYVYNKRHIKNASLLFELDNHENDTITYYCSIESDGDVVTIPISIVEKNYFYEKNETRNLILGFYYGLLIIVIIINLFYYFNMKDKSYLFYILYLISLFMFLFIRDGFAYKYLWQNSPLWNNISIVFFSMSSVITVLLMVRITLHTKKNFPVIDKIIIFSIVIISLLTILPIFSKSFYLFMISFGNIITGLGIILSFITIIKALKKKIYFAKYFFAAIIFLLLGAIWLVMKNNGATGIFEFEHGMKIGSGLEVVILAYGLTVKFKNMLKESQQQSISRLEEINKMKETANQILEKEVIKRTEQLQKSYEEIKLANLEINQQKEELKASAENLKFLNNDLTRKNVKINKQSEILKATNDLLKERNEEINQQKEEIIAQRDEIVNQRDTVLSQKAILTQSIVYAKRIQQAVFPPVSQFSELFNESFVFFIPRDIVSGDFYWIKQLKNSILIAVADCTGHGVPGAFMSMLGIAFLNEVLIRDNINRPDIALNALRDNIISALHQTEDKSNNKDGMDIAFCEIQPQTKKIFFAGANMPLYIVRQKNNKPELHILEGDKMPIGIYQRTDNFTNHTFDYQSDDIIYMFTDGFRDQFGENGDRKFLLQNFKNLLLSFSNEKLEIQSKIIEKTFSEWKGSLKQIDDVTVIGIKI